MSDRETYVQGGDTETNAALQRLAGAFVDGEGVTLSAEEVRLISHNFTELSMEVLKCRLAAFDLALA